MSLWSRIERRLSDLADELLGDELDEQVDAARSLLDGGRPAAAEAALETMLAQRPGHAGALTLLGAARLERGDADAARGAFERALKARPDLPAALLGLGHAALALAEPQAAVDRFRAATNAAGGDRAVLALSYRGLGIAYRRTGDFDKAVRELRKSVAEDGADVLARAALGDALLAESRGSGEEARHHLQRALRDASAAEPEALAADMVLARVIACLALGRLALDDDDSDLARTFFDRVQQALDIPAEGTDLDIGASTDPGTEAGDNPDVDPGREPDAGPDADPDAQARDNPGPEARPQRDRQRLLPDNTWAGPAKEYRISALIGLGDAALVDSATDTAHQHYLQALALSPQSSVVHARLGDVHRQVRDLEAALVSYERALTINSDAQILQRALDTALEAELVDAAVRLANDMLLIDPAHPRATVARGIGLVKQGQLDAARATFRAVIEAGDDLEAHLALGQLELAGDAIPLGAEASRRAGARAASEALAALRLDPKHNRARALLAAARHRELGMVEPPLADDASGMYRLAGQLQRLALAHSELSDLAGAAARAAADYDQPLLVTVMGEFSSGKSTFVNAFIGSDVAPTGITPTTATINIVKYGREPGGRILYRDGVIESLGWDELFRALHVLDPAQTRRIDVVEILYPLPQLERVNIVDTPGLNSILPEHEEVARGFIARADAVVWVFTANQAGKASEREALKRIHQEGKRILGVLNKVDQVAPSERDQLVDYVQGELGTLVEVVVPVAARNALAHKRQAQTAPDSSPPQAEPEDPLERTGNWATLEEALETRFFAQARQLKGDACGRRLAGVIDRARAVLGPQRQRSVDTAARLRHSADALAEAGMGFIDDVVSRERSVLQDAVTSLYRRAAREVLDLVRPRQLPFGSHSATAADRDYLISLLDSGYEAALEPSRRAVVTVLEHHRDRAVAAIAGEALVLGRDAVSDLTRTGMDALRLVEAQVFAPVRAYLRGYVRGGYVSSFFRHDLPKIELVEDAVYSALWRNAPDVDGEIALRLATAGTAAINALSERLAHWAEVTDVMAYDIEAGVMRALDDVEQTLQQLTARLAQTPQSRSDGTDANPDPTTTDAT